MKKSILFLTDVTNGETEDLITTSYLQRKYDVTISYLDNIKPIEDKFDLIIVRDTWPCDHEKSKSYNTIKNDFQVRARQKGLKVYNSLDASGDMAGKKYLLDLFKKKYPVIPTINSIKDIKLLPKVNAYLIKPFGGFSSIGVQTLTLKELIKLNPKNYLIQPKYNFKFEISFYFVDSKFMYCLIFEPSKIPSWPEPKLYNPAKKELDFAKKFVSWNKMRTGIQRIDAIMLKNNTLLLLEIEDDSPYFSLTEINEKLQNKFLANFEHSISNYLKQ